ncbi:hypothetical protein QYM36_015272 [Artemia franciscana]|uniref:Uncharacterized protein n=1 Tax=Artemia franciscana TaxID=6661 RepID=A0AA88HEK5_ARTSF|nr:hypothetical protein QYM36_015272 [Artemia franciscana]
MHPLYAGDVEPVEGNGELEPYERTFIGSPIFSNHAKLNIIVCYAAKNEADKDEKDKFYEILQAVTKVVPRHDILCVVGIINGKAEVDRQYCPEAMGPFGIGVISKNRALLVDYALSNYFIVGGTITQLLLGVPRWSDKNRIDRFLV